MSSPIVGARRPSAGAVALGPTERFAAGQRGFRLLGWFGVALALVGLADTLLVFVPPLWGNAEWAFTTAVQVVSSLPILAVALGAMTVAALASGGPGLARVVGGLNLLLVAALIGALVLFVPAAGEALEIGAPVAQAGIRKVIVRVAVYAVAFGALHLALAVKCFRSARALAAVAR